MTTEQILDAWCDAWPAIRAQHFRPDCCIAASNIAVRAARALGLTGYCVTADAVYANEAAAKMIARHVPAAHWPDAAWSVGVDTTGTEEAGQFSGHLVAIIDGWLLDLSAEQATRPERGLLVPPIALPPGYHDADQWTGYRPGPPPLYVEYRLRRGVRRWRNAPDAQRPYPEIVDALVAAVDINVEVP